MTRAKRRKIRREHSRLALAVTQGMPLAGAMLTGATVVHAQQPENSGGLEEVVVTATKREETAQNVPMSIQAIGTERLEQLGISNFNDYVAYLPSVSYQTIAPGFARVFMRGAAAGDNGNHSGPMPGVGQYLDEQPITTITGALDIHMYDIARVESLAGPQGTLYGASSQSGTIRIITNKPDPSAFKAGYEVEGNSVAHGDPGYQVQGFANIPISDSAAVRLVGWYDHEGGYIDNVRGTLTYPSSGVTDNNFARAKDNYNDVSTLGGRAALKIDLNDNWTITPTVMAQRQTANGIFGYDPSIGDLEVTHFHPESSEDRWVQAALTVEGRFSLFDVTYAGSYLKRDVDSHADYSDYAFFYDGPDFGYGKYFYDNDGTLISPTELINAKDGYTKQSHELRFSTPKDKRVRFVGGLFAQRQTHDIQQVYVVPGLNDNIDVTGWADDTWWLTKQMRIDRDYAVFGELTVSATDKLEFTGGARSFRAQNSLEGFFGYGIDNSFGSSTGEGSCVVGSPTFHGAPCINLPFTEVKENDTTYKLNATYHFDKDHLVYATYSEGFRPGGVNRRGGFPPYKADFLTNYEIGWKTSWLGDRLRFNGAVFLEQWDKFQFSYLGQSGLTNVKNASDAQIKGIEADLQWAPVDGLTLYGGISLIDPKLTKDFCRQLTPDGAELPPPGSTGDPDTECNVIDFAGKGTRLPTSPKFKGNLTARYEFPMAGLDAYVQGSLMHQSSAPSALIPADNDYLRTQDAYSIADLTFGFTKNSYGVELFVNNLTDERADIYHYEECAVYSPTAKLPLCAPKPYFVTNKPRVIGLKFSQKF
jgi:iron complex outermembrane receptor protein